MHFFKENYHPETSKLYKPLLLGVTDEATLDAVRIIT
jgi:hypothetical protein